MMLCIFRNNPEERRCPGKPIHYMDVKGQWCDVILEGFDNPDYRYWPDWKHWCFDVNENDVDIIYVGTRNPGHDSSPVYKVRKKVKKVKVVKREIIREEKEVELW